MAGLPARVSTPPHVLTRELDGELVLLNLKNESYYGLNQSATRIWSVLTSTASVEEGLGLLLSEIEVDPRLLREDVARLLDDLVNQGLVEFDSD